MFADVLFCFSSVIPRQLSKTALSTMADEAFRGTSSVDGNRETKLIIAIYDNEYNSLVDNQRRTTYFSVLGATVHWTENGYALSDLHFYLFVAKNDCVYISAYPKWLHFQYFRRHLRWYMFYIYVKRCLKTHVFYMVRFHVLRNRLPIKSDTNHD